MIRPTLAAGLLALCASSAHAVDFGVMETGDVIDPREFKFIAFPLFVREGEKAREQDSGVAVGLGYGITEKLDVELQIANYDDIVWFGADAEYSYWGNGDTRVDLSIGGGAHSANSDFGHPFGFDVTHIASYTLESAPRVRLNGAIDFAYERVEDRYMTITGSEREYTTLHFVPGVQWRLSDRVDLIGEVGVPLEKDASRYGAIGLSMYFKPERGARY